MIREWLERARERRAPEPEQMRREPGMMSSRLVERSVFG